jgi:hypothetical protein
MLAGSLELQLYADVARIKTDMDRSRSIIGGALSMIDKQAAALKSVLGGLASGLSAGAMIAFIKGALDGAASLHDLSIQSGIAVEALSGLAVVGKATGTGADMIAGSSNKLSKALATSNEESRGAAAAIKALGLNFDEVLRMSPDQRMRAIAVAMNQFQDGGQKSAAAMLLFGKAGAEMLPFLKDLAVAGDLHAKVTEQQAQAAHSFERNLAQLKTQAEQWKKTLAMDLLPTLNDIVDAMKEITKQSNTAGESLLTGVLRTGLETVGVLGANIVYVFRQVGNEIGGIAAQLVAFFSGNFSGAGAIGDQMKVDAYNARVEVDKLSNSILGITNSRAGAGRGSVNPQLLGPIPAKPELTGLSVQGKEGEKHYASLVKAIDEKIAADRAELAAGRQLTDFEKFYTKTMADAKSAKSGLTSEQIKAVQTHLNEAKAIDDLLQVQKAQQANNTNYAKDWEKTQKELADDEAARNTRRGQVAMQTYEETQALKDQNAQYVLERSLIGASDTERSLALDNLRVDIQLRKDLEAVDADRMLNEEARDRRKKALMDNAADAKQLNQFKSQTDEMSKVWGNAFSSMEDALVNFVTTGRLNFSSLVNGMISDLARLVIHQSIIAPMASALSGSSFFSSIGGLFGLSGARANGGPVAAGSSYLVGERGPEIFTPTSSGGITPNGHGGGGTTVIIQNTIGSVASQSDVVQGMKRVREQIIGELGRGRAYGGAGS